MKAELYKRLFRAIFSEDIASLKKIAITIIQEERKLGHNVLADSLEKISITEKPKYTLFDSRKNESGLSALPKSKRTNSQLVSYIPREQLKHHMILPNEVEERLLSIEQEYVARERLKKFNLVPKTKILLYGPPGLVLATTNLKVSLDEALFRRFDDVIEMPMPGKLERKRLLEMTLSAIPVAPDIDMDKISNQLEGYSAANVVLIAQRAAKIGILAGCKKVCNEHFVKALEESSKF